MRNKIFAVVIALVITAIVGSGIYVLVLPESEYEEVNWETYEHTDAYDYRYYLGLEKKEKIAYENILNNYLTFPERIEVPGLSDDELKEVFTALLYDNPLLFCFDKNCKILSSGSKFYFKPQYTMSKAVYEKRVREIRNLTPDIIANLPAGDFEVELYLHNYIIDRCTYTDTDSFDETTVYGALIMGKASCEGYSHAMKYLSDLCQLDCYVLFGSAESKDGIYGNHMWNIITIDGEKYHLDATWNDTVAKDDDSEEHRYMYFNVTDEEIKKTHSDFETTDNCTSVKSNYYVRNNLSFDSFGELEKKSLAKKIAKRADEGYTTIGIRFETDELFEKTKKELLEEQKIFSILNEADRISDKKITTKRFHYRDVDDVKIFEIMFSVV